MEDKNITEFALPSPNFNKLRNEPNKTSLHYLTPCGMTLLPRGKQPPPMYGARGSTVPAKYLKEDKPQPQILAETPPVYNSPPRPEYCSNCAMELATSQDMKRHLQQHETCPADDCDFSALSAALDRHVEANHITGLYQKVKKVWTPEDIAAWRAERRKRFPTAVNVELAKRAKEQRLKRGERLEASKARFGQVEDRKRTRMRTHQPQSSGGGEMNPNKRRTKQNARKPNKQQKKSKTEKEQPIIEKKNEEDSSLGTIEKFRGTSEMLDYKHVKDKKAVGNVLTNLLGMYGSDTDDDEGDECKEALVSDSTPLTVETVSALEEPEMKEIATDIQFIKQTQLIESTVPPSDDDEAPDEMPIERVTAEDEVPVENKEIVIKSHAEEEKPSTSGKPAVKNIIIPTKKRQYGLNFKRAKQLYKQSTMLSKLLASDIRHERNVLLQCVRYVCERDFFGIGASHQDDGNNIGATS